MSSQSLFLHQQRCYSGPPGSHAMDRVARVVHWISPATVRIEACHMLETMAKQLDAYCDEASVAEEA